MNAWWEHLFLVPQLGAGWRTASWAVKFQLEALCHFSLRVWAAHLTPGVALITTPSLYIKWRESQHYPFLFVLLSPFPLPLPSSLFPPPFPPSPPCHSHSLTLPPSSQSLSLSCPFPFIVPQIQQNKTKQQFSFQRTKTDSLFLSQMWATMSSDFMLQWGSNFRKVL